jgi:hypothetical protein
MSAEILKIYNIIDYIKLFISNDVVIPNIKQFDYFNYENLIDVISNGLTNSTYKNNIISIDDYEIIVDNIEDTYYEITIIKNIDLYEPKGPSK